MHFQPPRPRARRETILPMINVVFLLLIFFLMTAQIAPAPPLDITPPEATTDTAEAPPRTLWISADGLMVHDEHTGEAALAALVAGVGPVLIHADARLPAAELARLMRWLTVRGVIDLRLATLSRATP